MAIGLVFFFALSFNYTSFSLQNVFVVEEASVPKDEFVFFTDDFSQFDTFRGHLDTLTTKFKRISSSKRGKTETKNYCNKEFSLEMKTLCRILPNKRPPFYMIANNKELEEKIVFKEMRPGRILGRT